MVVPNNYEGVRISCAEENQKGWFLLRMSLHDPVLPLNVESEVKGGAREITGHLAEFLGSIPDIDYGKIKEYIK